MSFGWLFSKYTVSNLQVYLRLFYHPHLRLWQHLGLWLSLAGSSACATAATVPIPEATVEPTANPVVLPLPKFLQPDNSLGTKQDSVSLDVGFSLPTVETEILWSEVAVEPSLTNPALANQNLPLRYLSQLNAPSEVEVQSQQERHLEQTLADPELGNLRLQKPGDAVQESSGEPEEPGKATDNESDTSDTTNISNSEAEPQAADPELGNLRLQESVENSNQQLDPELGTLRLRQQPVQASRSQRTVYLQGRVDFFQSDNIFSSVDPINDSLIRTGLSLWATPAIGPKTYLIGSINANLIKYANLDDFDYNEVRVGASIYQQLTPKMYGEVGLSNQQLFTAGGGDRFLNDNSIRVGLGRRDSLGNAVTIDSFYQLRYSFADPSDRSRVVNALGASLNYNPTSKVQTGLDYQYVLSSFTEQGREDNYHQLLARLSYDWSRNSRITVFGGFGCGNSSNRNVNFDSSILGVSLSVNLPLF
ncbi:hypothetical protein [Trichocoleus sp. FACHB-262]|uniref:hypothetical protein n=1 Tax=Trichocoleus sp. FACHB-262 TaxID=2692869 RepID=UPI0016862CD1|nr:hypothetical protein [Trichocoleus sp. FACHB-262]MBD2122780.1 hypothetical protein [Trichocoleus sp. FACHB-262]